MYANDFDYYEQDGNAFKGPEQEAVYTIKKIASKRKISAWDNDIDLNCSCKWAIKRAKLHGNSLLEEGWEGSAMIAHGSILTFGCLTFVFSTVEKFTNR